MISYHLDHLQILETEAIHIIREVAGEFDRPAILFSGGKDSICLLRLAEKAFRPSDIPMPPIRARIGCGAGTRAACSGVSTRLALAVDPAHAIPGLHEFAQQGGGDDGVEVQRHLLAVVDSQAQGDAVASAEAREALHARCSEALLGGRVLWALRLADGFPSLNVLSRYAVAAFVLHGPSPILIGMIP